MKTLSLAYQSLLINDDDEDEHKIKHSASEPVMKTGKPKATAAAASSFILDMDDDDDDDVWCNQEDEDNLKFRVKLDEQKERQLREILGDETLEIVRNALKVSNREAVFPRCPMKSPFLG